MNNDSKTVIQVAPAPYVTQEVAAAITGYSVKAIERKRADGIWVEGDVWIRAEDGRPLISIEGYRKWVERGRTLR